MAEGVGDKLEEGLDDAARSAEDVEEEVGGSFGRLAGLAAAVGAAFITSIIDAALQAQAELAALEILQGGGTEASQRTYSEVRQLGIAAPEAADAVAALTGNANQLGIAPDDQLVAGAFGSLANAGVDRTTLARTLAQFGIEGSGDIVGQAQLAYSEATSQGVDPQQLFQALGTYGPVLTALGLDFLQSAAFITDLTRKGIPVSRVTPAFNAAIRNAVVAGTDPFDEVSTVFDQIVEAGSTNEAIGIATPVFGAQGSLRIVNALRSGEVGLNQQLELDPGLAEAESIFRVGNPNFVESARAFTEGLIASPDPEAKLYGYALAARFGVSDLIGQVPIIGGLLGAGSELAIGGITQLERNLLGLDNIDDTPETVGDFGLGTTIEEYNARQGNRRVVVELGDDTIERLADRISGAGGDLAGRRSPNTVPVIYDDDVSPRSNVVPRLARFGPQ